MHFNQWATWDYGHFRKSRPLLENLPPGLIMFKDLPGAPHINLVWNISETLKQSHVSNTLWSDWSKIIPLKKSAHRKLAKRTKRNCFMFQLTWWGIEVVSSFGFFWIRYQVSVSVPFNVQNQDRSRYRSRSISRSETSLGISPVQYLELRLVLVLFNVENRDWSHCL